MAVQLINIGNVANDGTGDDLREAFIKVNQNFEELDLRDDENTSASNLGDEGEGLFVRRNVYDLEFKKISAGANIALTADDNKIVIAYTGVTDLASDPAPQLSADLDAQSNNLLNVGTISSSGITGPLTGNVTGLVHGVDIRDLNFYKLPENSWNFGELGQETVITNIFDYVFAATDVDFGLLTSATPVDLDFASF